jgi:FkbM family methyltransferase
MQYLARLSRRIFGARARQRRRDDKASQRALLECAVATLATKGPLTIVQAGANDGKDGDPVHDLVRQFAGLALLVEPQPDIAADITANYAGFQGDLRVVTAAIGTDDGSTVLYRVNDAHLDEYMAKVGRHPSKIASFDKAQLLGKVADRLGRSVAEAEDCIEAIPVEVTTIESLSARHGIERIDFLQVDCEGADMDVIRSLGAMRPNLINFEAWLLSDADWQAWVTWAAANGYGYRRSHMDCLAVRGAASLWLRK